MPYVTIDGTRWYAIPVDTDASTPNPPATISLQQPAMPPQQAPPQQAPLPQQPQPQQAMDTSSSGNPGSAPAFSSPPPILNLQEFLSGYAPASDAAPFGFSFGGPSPLGGGATLDDPFAGIPGITGLRPEAMLTAGGGGGGGARNVPCE